MFSSIRLTSRSIKTVRRRAICARCYATQANTDDGWQVIIGLEIHAQLRTKRKLFSNAPLFFGDMPNTHVEPLDSAIPGSLPVLDPEAIRLGVFTALALKCQINPRSTFDRKHYFYHDIPASYQITQHYNPLARNGSLQINKGDNGSERDLLVRINQLQIEQDTAKSQSVGDDQLVDLNRAGTGLMEIVTEPDMRSSEEAGAFVRKLQSLLRRLGSCDGDMEKGNLRVDVNISVHKPGTPFGTRCEIKNLNSVRFLQQAIDFERARHIEHYQTSDEPLRQETRSYNELTGETRSMRSKEEAEDYRYMPDSNLPALVIKDSYIDKLAANLPEMPWDTINRISSSCDVLKSDVETILGLDEFEATGIKYFDEVSQGDPIIGKKALIWIGYDTLAHLHKANRTWTPDIVPSRLMRDMITSTIDGRVTTQNAKIVLKHVLDAPQDGQKTFEELLIQLKVPTSDSVDFDLKAICQETIDKFPVVAENVKNGQAKAISRLIGDVMKKSKGAADGGQVREMLLKLLGL